MKEFRKFYTWALDIKENAGIWSMAIIFITVLLSAITGNPVIGLWQVVTAIVIALIIAVLQSYIVEKMPVIKVLSPRSIAWSLISALLPLAASLIFSWFTEVWCYILLPVFIFVGSLFMVLGLKWEQEKGTERLNADLKSFKK